MQRDIAFHQDYGFEYSLLEPVDFWKRVPPLVRPYYHFFNAPISADTDRDALSPYNFLLQIATPQDFVSFKLDIDTPSIEIPLALQLLNDPKIAELVDEFFFELHFRCEILMTCSWPNSIPKEINGLKMERYSAMKFFQKLRELGIRSHFWP